MRRLYSPEGLPVSPEEIKEFEKKTEEELRQPLETPHPDWDELFKVYVDIKEVEVGEKIGSAVYLESLPQERIKPVFELYNNLLDVLYPLLLSELRRSGIKESEEDLLKQHLISKEEIFKRTVLAFGPQDPRYHPHHDQFLQVPSKIVLDCRSAVGNDFNLQHFINAAIHEIVHYISYIEFVKVAEGNWSNDEYRTMVSGYSKKNKITPSNFHLNEGLNYFSEGVVELYARELYTKVVSSMDLNRELTWANYEGVISTEDKPRGAKDDIRVEERELVEVILEHLAEFYDVDKNYLWSAVKRGLLEGQDLDSEPMKSFLEDCFGRDIIKDIAYELPDKGDYLRKIEIGWVNVGLRKLKRRSSLTGKFIAWLEGKI